MNDLPPGFTLDQPETSSSLPSGFALDTTQDNDIPTPTPPAELAAQAEALRNRPLLEKVGENIRQNTMMGGATDWRNVLAAAPPSASVAGITGAGEGAFSTAIKTLVGQSAPNKLAMTRAAGQAEGLAVPASQSGRANIIGRVLESIVPKEFISQAGTLRNQPAFRRMAALELGLPANAEISKPLLRDIRKNAGAIYEKVKRTGTIIADAGYLDDLVKIRDEFLGAAMDFPKAAKIDLLKKLGGLAPMQKDGTVKFGADAAVQMIRQLRDSASEAFDAGKKLEGTTYRQMADAIEKQLGRHLDELNLPWIDEYRKARELIAKSHTIEDALNIGTGDIRAADIAAAEPPGGRLQTIAEFAKAFPRVSRDPAQYGSERLFNLSDVLTAILGGQFLGPEYMLLGAARPAGKYVASKLALSGQPMPAALQLQSLIAAVRAARGEQVLDRHIGEIRKRIGEITNAESP